MWSCDPSRPSVGWDRWRWELRDRSLQPPKKLSTKPINYPNQLVNFHLNFKQFPQASKYFQQQQKKSILLKISKMSRTNFDELSTVSAYFWRIPSEIWKNPERIFKELYIVLEGMSEILRTSGKKKISKRITNLQRIVQNSRRSQSESAWTLKNPERILANHQAMVRHR